ncbi:ABC transporter substrate-binding protein [Natrinema sp. LN54]|uniref:ABC transporter substrate-binding protein n=1 Tax=Natrinema sp. LN54 TaxID=3458705 RepID=UPI00403718D6
MAGCLGGSDSSDTFTLGAIHPLSGDAAEMGSRFQDVVSAGVQAVNEGASDLEPLAGADGEGLPGQDGTEVEVLWADHQGSSDVARSEAESMVLDDGVDVLLGSYYSGTTEVVSQVAQREGVPHVCGTAIGEGLTERDLDWFWQVPPHTGVKGESMFEFADGMNEQHDAGLETVSIIHQDGTFGTEVANSMQRVVEESDFELALDTISYSAQSVNSLSTEIRNIEQAGADIIVHAANVRDAVIMLEDMQTEDYYPELMLTPGSAYLDPSLLEESVSDYVFSGSDFAHDMFEVHPPMGAYNSYSEEESGTPFDGSSIYAWGEFFTAIAAADRAESLSSDDLRASLNSMSAEPYVAGLPYPVEFDDTGYNQEAFSFVVQSEDSQLETVWPFDQAQDGAMTYPVPSWDER